MMQQEMKLEDLRQNFPEMPSELRKMVEKEVQKQIGMALPKRRRRHMARKTIAAVMLLGTTVFAGIAYKMHSEPAGKYAVNIKIDEMDQAETEENSSTAGQMQEVIDIKNVRMEVSYLPEGMVETEDGKYSYTDALSLGHVDIRR